MRLFTSRFHNRELRDRPDLVKAAIVVGKPRWPVGFDYVTLNILAPYGRLFKINDRLQFTQAYFEKLDALGVGVIRAEFERISNEHGDKDLVLLCYENLKAWRVVPPAGVFAVVVAGDRRDHRGAGDRLLAAVSQEKRHKVPGLAAFWPQGERWGL